LSREQCETIASEAGCEVANVNSPAQVVLSGTVESIEKACRIVESKGDVRVIRLKVGGAFHSRLMQKARERLEAVLKDVTIHIPCCTFIPNAKAEKVSDPEEIRSLLSKQLTSPVLWVQTMAKAAEEGISVFLEIGPGRVLKGLARKSQPHFEVYACGTVQDLEKIDELIATHK
ncbi:MAG: ACP S-malonyltransferase, partial [Candidatus Omnitrophica bacterium]|nr:ACP S-malonyltransferase [Candidatus Omnitrophota bacterium]